jgi:nicotinamidase/pyrazinamidase
MKSNRDKTLLFNVDTQHDFMDKDGALYVDGAENIKPMLRKISQFAKDNDISMVHTSDWHHFDSEELSKTPDFVNTFPNHCMAGTKGAYLIPETKPRKFDAIINWDQYMSGHMIDNLNRPFDIMLRKDKFNFVDGNKNSKKLLAILREEFDHVIVFGVAGNVCVNEAVKELSNKKNFLVSPFKVSVITDGIANLPNIPSCENDWEKMDVDLIEFSNLK